MANTTYVKQVVDNDPNPPEESETKKAPSKEERLAEVMKQLKFIGEQITRVSMPFGPCRNAARINLKNSNPSPIVAF